MGISIAGLAGSGQVHGQRPQQNDECPQNDWPA